jgi:hypothetical protein
VIGSNELTLIKSSATDQGSGNSLISDGTKSS